MELYGSATSSFVRSSIYDKKIEPGLFDLLGIDLTENHMGINPYDLIQPLSCSLDIMNRRIEFNTMI